jgi:hypothetical protein
MSKQLRITYRQRTTGGVHAATRRTADIPADATVETVGGFLVFRDRHRAVVLMVPEVSTDAIEQVNDEPTTASVPLSGRDIVLTEIADERTAQDAKWGEQNHPLISRMLADIADERDAATKAAILYQVPTAHTARLACQLNEPGNDDWAAILLEEYCEFLEAAAMRDEPGARAELVQLGAVAAAAVEAMDRRRAK